MTDSDATTGAAAPRPSGRRAKLVGILVTALLALAILGAWTQTWFTLTLTTGQQIAVTGDIAAPALTALALTILVLLGALAIAGPFFRIVLTLLQALIGVTVVLSASLAIGSPVTASAAAITTASGVAGDNSTAALVDGYAATAWPVISLIAGVLLVVTAIAMLVTSRTWPGATRKYQPVRLDPTEDAASLPGTAAPVARSSVDDWDSLSRGTDPTGTDQNSTESNSTESNGTESTSTGPTHVDPEQTR